MDLYKLFILILAMVTVSNTFILSKRSSGSQISPMLNFMRSPESIEVFNKLENSRNEKFIITTDNSYLAGWLSYHGRKNDLWLLPSIIGDINLKELSKIYKFQFYNYDSVQDAEVINLTPFNFIKFSDEKLKNNAAFSISNEYGIDGQPDHMHAWLGKELQINTWSKNNFQKSLNLSLNVRPGPSTKDSNRKIRIGNDDIGWKEYEFSYESKIMYHFKLKTGSDKIYIQTITPTESDVQVPSDPRKLFVDITNIEIETVD